MMIKHPRRELDGIIIALDAGRRTGFCYGAPGAEWPTLGTRRLAPDETDLPVDVFRRADRWFGRLLAEVKPVAVVIELPIPPSNVWGATNFATTVILIGLYAQFVGKAAAADVRILEAPINSWRKYFIGYGDMKGDAAKRAAKRQCRILGWEAVDDNAAEAAGIWSWGCAQLAPSKIRRRIEPLFAGRQ